MQTKGTDTDWMHLRWILIYIKHTIETKLIETKSNETLVECADWAYDIVYRRYDTG